MQSRNIIMIAFTLLVAGAGLLIYLIPAEPSAADEPVDTTEFAPAPSVIHNNLETASRTAAGENSKAVVNNPRPATAPELWSILIMHNSSSAAQIDKLLKEPSSDDPGTPIGRGRTASATGWVTLPKLAPFESSDVQIEFKYGLNAGRKSKVAIDGSYQIDDLYPGLNIVRFISGDKRAVDIEMLLKHNGEIRQDVTLGEREYINLVVNDPSSNDIRSAQTTIAGRPPMFGMYANGPDLIATISAKGYESRRELIHLTPNPSKTVNVILRRAASVTALYDIAPNSPPGFRVSNAIGMLLPASKTVTQKYPFESDGVLRADKRKQQIEFAGVPHQEPFDICLFADNGVVVPLLTQLNSIESEEPRPRIVNFTFEQRWPLSGCVVSGGKPVKGAIVRAEVEDVAFATARMFQDHGGVDRIPIPILPFARRIVETDASGMFTIETYDMIRPATLVIEATNSKRKYIPIDGAGTQNIGEIEMNPDRKKTAGEETPSITFEFPDERPRTITITKMFAPDAFELLDTKEMLKRLKPNPDNEQKLTCNGKLTSPLGVERGEYSIFAGKQGMKRVEPTKVTVDGPTTVPIR